MIRKSAVILGASGDIGKAICDKFASNGYNLGLTYNSCDLTDFANELKNKYNIDVECQKVDCKNEDEIACAVAYFEKAFGLISVGVSAFGIVDRESLLIDKTYEEINNVIQTNLLGTILVNKALSNSMIKRKSGAIINVASFLATNGGACEEVYSASKAGIIGLTKSLALELGEYHVRVNCVSPGFIDTKMCACYDSAEKDEIIQKTPLSRLGNPIDVANAVYFLSSDDASFITGVNLEVSGGLRI